MKKKDPYQLFNRSNNTKFSITYGDINLLRIKFDNLKSNKRLYLEVEPRERMEIYRHLSRVLLT